MLTWSRVCKLTILFYIYYCDFQLPARSDIWHCQWLVSWSFSSFTDSLPSHLIYNYTPQLNLTMLLQLSNALLVDVTKYSIFIFTLHSQQFAIFIVKSQRPKWNEFKFYARVREWRGHKWRKRFSYDTNWEIWYILKHFTVLMQQILLSTVFTSSIWCCTFFSDHQWWWWRWMMIWGYGIKKLEMQSFFSDFKQMWDNLKIKLSRFSIDDDYK